LILELYAPGGVPKIFNASASRPSNARLIIGCPKRMIDGGGVISKYPPAEPGALALEPLEAADGGANAAPKFWAT
jgi:hypothetical protein